MKCVECGAPISTPTADPFRCAFCRGERVLCGCDWVRLSPCPDHAALLTDAEAVRLEQMRNNECPVCGVKASDAAEVASEIHQEHDPTPAEVAEGRQVMAALGHRLLERAAGDALDDPSA